MSELQEYKKGLELNIQYATQANGTFPEEEFFNDSTFLLSESGILDDVEYSDYRNTRRGIRIDGFNWNPLERVISAIVIEYDENEEIRSLSRSEVENIALKAARFLEKMDDRKFLSALEETDPGKSAAESMSIHLEEVIKFRVIVITNGQLSKRVKKLQSKKIRGKETSLEIWDLERLKELEESGSENEPFTVDFKSMCGGLSALSANSSGTKSKINSYMCVMPATVLSDLYNEYGQRLLESNVRTFLDFRSNVNKGIRTSLLTEPENFFAYNNGLTVTASSIKTEKEGSALLITELENMQIVNGGQTTSAIYFAPKDKGGIASGQEYKDINLNKIFVQMKLTIIGDKEQSDLMKSSISRFANFQNSIQAADLVSNHPFHLRLETLSRRILMPASQETNLQSKWFYERARGQYSTLKRSKTPAEARKFEVEFPKRQVFVKTDMAKFENTWELRPYEVTRGAQKNLKFHGARISKAFEKDEDNFREPFYRNLIAKAILFKSSDSAILKSDWYQAERGYKAQITTYTLALLRHLLHKENLDLSLKRIFDNQSLSEPLTSQVLELGKFVRDKITDDEFRDGIANITEFCKREIAWQRFQKIDYKLEIIEKADTLNSKEVDSLKYGEEEDKKAGKQIEDLEAIMQISTQEWQAIADYFISRGYEVSHDNVSIPRLCTKVSTGKLPTDRQAKTALKVRKNALAGDFVFVEKNN